MKTPEKDFRVHRLHTHITDKKQIRTNVLYTGPWIDWLFNGTSTQKGQFVPTVGGKPAQSAKDGQRDTMHITLRYMITM